MLTYPIQAGLIFIYLLSFFSLAATIVRLHSVILFDSNIRHAQSLTQRMAYSYWAMLEIMTAIMCANLPALPALRRYVTRKFKKEPFDVSHPDSQTSPSRKSTIKQWLNRSAPSLFSKTRNGKSDSLSQASSTKEKKTNLNVSEMEVSSPSTGQPYSSRSLDSSTWEKRGQPNNGSVPNIPIDESRRAPTAFNIFPSAYNSHLEGPRSANESERTIYRTDEFMVKSNIV